MTVAKGAYQVNAAQVIHRRGARGQGKRSRDMIVANIGPGREVQAAGAFTGGLPSRHLAPWVASASGNTNRLHPTPHVDGLGAGAVLVSACGSTVDATNSMQSRKRGSMVAACGWKFFCGATSLELSQAVSSS